MRWLLIDEFKEIHKGEWAKAIRNVNRSEEIVEDTYPSVPVMPTSFLIEMMAQVTGVLVGATIDFKKEVVLAKVTDTTFTQPVFAPSTLEIEGNLVNLTDTAACCEAKVFLSGKMIANAVIFFGLFEALAQGPEHGKVFSENFMESFGIKNLIKKCRAKSPVPEAQGSRI